MEREYTAELVIESGDGDAVAEIAITITAANKRAAAKAALALLKQVGKTGLDDIELEAAD